VYEDEFVLAFHDIAPLAPVHVLVIPKGEYVSQADFGARAPAEMIVGFWRAVSKIARDLGLDPEGYRIVANHGPNGGQLVFHFHVHIFGGGIMGHSTGMPKPDKQA
jgi:diadenosine tetraphosphate (Ap4A) HIT family hydrolase